MSNERNEAAARIAAGMPAQVARAVYGIFANANNVDWEKAQAIDHLDGRTFSVPANTTQTFRVQWDQTFIIDKFRVTSDQHRNVEIRMTKPNDSGFLVGDSQNGVRVDVIDTTDEFLRLLCPWRIFPQEAFQIEIANTSGQTVRVNFGFGGFYVYGAR